MKSLDRIDFGKAMKAMKAIINIRFNLCQLGRSQVCRGFVSSRGRNQHAATSGSCSAGASETNLSTSTRLSPSVLLISFISALVAMGGSARAQSRLYVNTSASGANNGLSWTDAYNTVTGVKNALDYAATHPSVIEIWVAAGTYKPTGPGGLRTATHTLVSDVALFGGFAGAETLLSERNLGSGVTVLSGDLNGDDSGFDNNSDNSIHVVTADGVSNVVVDGFKISSGNATGMGGQTRLGGGLYVRLSNVLISNCEFEWNNAEVAGGAASFSQSSSPTFVQCDFHNNQSGARGGALADEGSNLIALKECSFSNNSTVGDGGAILVESSSHLTKCQFSSNQAQGNGGAVAGSQATIVNCTFTENQAAIDGGAVDGVTITLTNCLFAGNESTGGRGGAVSTLGQGDFVGCTFVGNSAALLGGAVAYLGGLDTTIANSVFWNNLDSTGTGSTTQIYDSGGGMWPVVIYSVVQGGWNGLGGAGVLDVDPLFVDEPDGDFRLQVHSPAIDSGNNTVVPVDILDLDNDADTAERTPIDLVGNVRFLEEVLASNEGAGVAPFVDMGAIEFARPVVFVDGDATGTNNGTTWVNAYRYIQDALAAAGASGGAITEIWVAEGTYKPAQKSCKSAVDCVGETCSGGMCSWAQPRGQSFQLVDGVSLYGGFAGTEDTLGARDPGIHVTTLSGDISGDDMFPFGNNGENSCRLVDGSGLSPTTRLDGFTIIGGNADISSCGHEGGGLRLISGANATIAKCIFQGNQAKQQGGGVYVEASSPVFQDCRFEFNDASSVTPFRGGGVSVEGASQVGFKTCDFIGNVARDGGAISIDSTDDAYIVNCRFVSNIAEGDGGAVSSFKGMNIINSLFSGNTALTGGAIECSSPSDSAVIVGCTFHGNSDGPGGGGGSGGIRDASGGAPTQVVNSIFWGNTGGGGSIQDQQYSGNVSVTYSVVEGFTTGGIGNLGMNPMFFDPDGPDNVAGTLDDDFRLLSGSPCIDSGDNGSVPLDVFDIDNDDDFTERIPLDLQRMSRFQEDLLARNTGVGPAPIVDMGALEFQRDCNGNGVSDDQDLLLGTSLDCDGNNVPDECDIASCPPGISECDDCNLNSVPDVCDDPDGHPDECVDFNGGCENDNGWNCPSNWLSNTVPNNSGPVTYSVTLDELDDVDLDIDVVIDTLALREESTLNVTATYSGGDLIIDKEGGLVIEGTLVESNNRSVDVLVGPVTVLESPYPMQPGTLALSQSAYFRVGSNLEINGTGAIACDVTPGKGNCTPPIVTNIGGAQLIVEGNLSLIGSVNFQNSSSAPIQLGGNFDNRALHSQCVNCEDGSMILDGVSLQTFEVGGVDLGPTLAGFGNAADTNFSMRRLEVGTPQEGAQARFTNTFANAVGSGACDEALYVHVLILNAGSIVTLDRCTVYYETLLDLGAAIIMIGCGQLSPITAASCVTSMDCTDDDVCTHDACTLTACAHSVVRFGNVNGAGTQTDLDDILCVLAGFSGISNCPNADLANCNPNGIVNIDDILAVLGAFAGADPCNCN